VSTDWVVRQPPGLSPAADPADSADLLTASGLPRDIATLLALRGVTTAAGAAAFLSPAIADLHDPLLLLGMREAVDLLVAAHSRGERVAVVGDYDVDGLTSTALLVGVFEALGIATHAILPNRHAGGYGLQPQHVAQAEERGCRLIVTADCGIQAHDAIAEASRRGLPVIVTDHHLPAEGPGAPALGAAAVVNPRQAGCSYPYPDLAGVGLALKLAAALLTRFGREIPWTSLCRMACLGTIADAAPLTGENRVFASRGLAALAATPSAGLRALLDEAEVGSPVTARDVGFRIGPRLNAAGRLGAPDPALELLLTRDAARARELAAQLGRFNDERRALEAQVVAECEARFSGPALPSVLVAWSAGWNRGVVGIAAGRLARQLHRPALLFAVEGGVAVGSGRSVPGLDFHGFLRAWESRLARFGGHAQAVGLTADVTALEGLAREWEEAAAGWAPESLTPRIEFDLGLEISEVTPELLDRLARLEPFGVGNPEPVFRVGPCRLAGAPRIFGNGHLGFLARGADGASVEVVAWSGAALAGALERPFEMLAAAELDRFRNRPRLRLLESRPAGDRTN
jgi:single-stranded-DNA-specific exonuclease